MLGVKLPNNIETWSYSDIRAFLILKSTGFKLLIGAFRKKYELEKLTPLKRSKSMSWVLRRDAAANLVDIARVLDIDKDFVENAVIGETLLERGNYKLLKTMSLPCFIASDTSPLTSGFYIKVGPNTTPEVAFKTCEHIIKAYRHLKKQHPDVYKRTHISNHYKRPINLTQNLLCTCLIEKIIWDALHYKNHSDISDSKDVVVEAIKFASEELKLSEAKTKGIFNRSRKTFAIPTYQEFRSFAFNLTKV